MHTGNIFRLLQNRVFLSVYPCAYREHIRSTRLLAHEFGLSLCIQGTLPLLPDGVQPKRFIPVHTGNILTITDNSAVAAVYPCAYREHNVGCSSSLSNFGLSLCIQGTYFADCFSLNPIGLSLCIQGT